ncbi:MAG: hypothetical protein AB7V16_05085 [Vulcanibacillus sp.]
MTEQKPDKKDFVNLINSVMGKKVMSESQLTQFLDEARIVNETKGTEGFLDFVQKNTNAPASKDQLRKLAENIKNTGNPFEAMDFLLKEKLVTDQQVRKISEAIEPIKKKSRKK